MICAFATVNYWGKKQKQIISECKVTAGPLPTHNDDQQNTDMLNIIYDLAHVSVCVHFCVWMGGEGFSPMADALLCSPPKS